jgi:FkbM family methyltransferase
MIITKRNISFNVVPSCYLINSDSWVCGGEAFWNAFMSDKEEDTPVLERFLSKDHSYIDIGAWVGSTTLFASKLAKKCYSYEPDPKAFEYLSKNISANPDVSNVEIFNMAVSAKSGKIKIGTKTEAGDSMSSSLWTEGSYEVDAISIKDIILNNNISDCNFIKIDIEGGEVDVLPAAYDVVKYTMPTIYLSLHTPWFENKKYYFDSIFQILKLYKNIYKSDGTKTSLNEVGLLNSFVGIVATNI